MNRMAKVPSKAATAVIATVRFTGPKRISTTITNFSMTAAIKIGTRVVGTYALYAVSAQTRKSNAPQCRIRKMFRASGLLAPNANCATGLGKRETARLPAAVATPEATSIHAIR